MAAVKTFGERIADALVEDGLLFAKQVEELLEQQKKEGTRLLKIIVDKGLVTEQQRFVFLPRRHYGAYLADVLAAASVGGQLTLIGETAVDLRQSSSGGEMCDMVTGALAAVATQSRYSCHRPV